MTTDVAFRTCPLCEATCGLELTLDGREVTRVRGDRDDVFSRGFICPKGSVLHKLDRDPNRVREPLVRRDGELVPVSWEDAFAEISARLGVIVDRHGRDAVAVYLGNPNAHHLASQLYLGAVLKSLGTKNAFSASTLDQMPKHVSSGLMFGTPMSIPVPDVDRTDYLLMLGANPYESNGSLLTAPDIPGRLEALRARGGRLVVVDPRRTRTADHADEHVAIRPGTDPFLLFGIVHELVRADRIDLGRLAEWCAGLEEVTSLAKAFARDVVAPVCGIDAGVIVRLAHELADAPTAAVYGRIGTSTTRFGTITSWLVDVVNVLTGNLDRAGGAMFTLPALGSANTRGTPGTGRGFTTGRWHSRVGQHPEVMGELPAAALAEEIETPGEGQVRALLTIAGNPVLSAPEGRRLDAALQTLELQVSVDIYRNETTRHADVLLPSASTLCQGHYDVALYQLAVRNIAHYSPPVMTVPDGQIADDELLLRLALAVGQQPASAEDAAALDDLLAADLAQKSGVELPAGRRGPERLLDLMLRSGPYGLTIDELLAAPHGIDLGPLEPRMPDVLRTPSGRIELAPAAIVADVARLEAVVHEPVPELVLVGRRDLRSNNSWMHNVEVLVKGKPRCTLHINPDDAARVGVADGSEVRVCSRVGEIVACAEVTDRVAPGVVSLPHGWGHDLPDAELAVARAHAGVNTNVLTDGAVLDPLSGTVALNGIPVTVERPEGS